METHDTFEAAMWHTSSLVWEISEKELSYYSSIP